MSTFTLNVQEMFLGGTETVSTTVEWAMTELLHNPDKMSKAKAELDEFVGKDKDLEENDLSKLQYLHAVVKETLRLHPPLPFLIPRKATKDISFMGYNIPKNTQLFVNVWAIGRDPESWGDNCRSFEPERFLGSNIEYKGNHFQLLPFGAGRRICIGLQLGQPLIFSSMKIFYKI